MTSDNTSARTNGAPAMSASNERSSRRAPKRCAGGCSFQDRLDPLCLEAFQMVLHLLQLLRGVPLPIQDLPGHSQRVARAVGLRRIPGKSLVGQVGIVLDR